MLIKQFRTISYICPICGSTHFETISLFDFSGKSELSVVCKCGKSRLKITTKDYKKYSLTIPCIGCGNEHNTAYGFYDMWVRPLNMLKCSQNGFEYCFIGDDSEVRRQFDTLEEKEDSVADNLGFEKHFSNSRVMLEAFNKIHDIAEQGNIICECGCKDISVSMLYDKLILHCTSCIGMDIIGAKDSFDLKNILQKQQIILYKQIQYI